MSTIETQRDDYPFPSWWDSHGCNMYVAELAGKDPNELLRIASPSGRAELGIFRTDLHPLMGFRQWLLKWRLDHGQMHVNGDVIFDDELLKAAFGLTDTFTQIPSTEFLNERRATIGMNGCFIRDREYLNIPAPGSGITGDPNISILLDSRIVYSVSRLFVGEEVHPAPSVAHVFRYSMMPPTTYLLDQDPST